MGLCFKRLNCREIIKKAPEVGLYSEDDQGWLESGMEGENFDFE